MKTVFNIFTGKMQFLAEGGSTPVDGDLIFQGDFDASAGQLPQNAEKGYFWKVSVAGTIGGLVMSVADSIYATEDTDATPTESQFVLIKGGAIAEYMKQVFADTCEPTGFVNRTSSDLSFDNPTRTLSIQPTATDFDYYQKGVKYTSTGDTVQIGDVEGLWFIYYNGATLTATQTFTDELITSNSLVSVVYWNATDSEVIYFADERHGITMDGADHLAWHQQVGTRFVSGLALNTFDADGSGDDNSAAQFGVDLGEIADEDLYFDIDAIPSTTGLPVFWKSGAAGDWKRTENSGYSLLTTGTGLPAWNEFTGGVWQQTELSSNDFILCHVFATNSVIDPVISIMGQADYTTVGNARDGVLVEVGNLITAGLPFAEFKYIGSVILQGSSAYTNAIKARVRTNDEGEDWTDFRKTGISNTTTPSSHDNLSGVLPAGTGVASGHISNKYPLQFPELTTTERDAIVSPNLGMKIFNTTTATYQQYNGSGWVDDPSGGGFSFGTSVAGTSGKGLEINNATGQATAAVTGFVYGNAFNTNSAFDSIGFRVDNEHNAGTGYNTGIYLINKSTEVKSGDLKGAGLDAYQSGAGGTLIRLQTLTSLSSPTKLLEAKLSNTQAAAHTVITADIGSSAQAHKAVYATGNNASTGARLIQAVAGASFTGRVLDLSTSNTSSASARMISIGLPTPASNGSGFLGSQIYSSNSVDHAHGVNTVHFTHNQYDGNSGNNILRTQPAFFFNRVCYSANGSNGTQTVSDDSFYIKRSDQQANASGTFNSSGSALKIEHTIFNPAGTIVDTAVLLDLIQHNDSDGGHIKMNAYTGAPTADGTLWFDGSDLKLRAGGVTYILTKS